LRKARDNLKVALRNNPDDSTKSRDFVVAIGDRIVATILAYKESSLIIDKARFETLLWEFAASEFTLKQAVELQRFYAVLAKTVPGNRV
jgi:hypothetical protein